MLVGNKTDLFGDRMITTDQGKRLADSWNAAFLETSAKQNEVNNIQQDHYFHAKNLQI